MSVDMTTEELKRLAENIMPGPWKIADFWGSGMLEICPDYPHPSGGEWADIAQVNDLGDTYDDASQYPNTPVLAQAHARAIALVPDLLRELIERRKADAPVTAREAELEAEIERLTARAKKAEAERDEARAQVAAAFETAASFVEAHGQYVRSAMEPVGPGMDPDLTLAGIAERRIMNAALERMANTCATMALALRALSSGEASHD